MRGLMILGMLICLVQAAVASELTFSTVPGGCTVTENGRPVAAGPAGDRADFQVDAGTDQIHRFDIERPPFDAIHLTVRWTSQGWQRLDDSGQWVQCRGTVLALRRTIRLNVSPPDSDVAAEVDPGCAKAHTVCVAGVDHRVVALDRLPDGRYSLPHGLFPPALVVSRSGYAARLVAFPARTLDSHGDVFPRTPLSLERDTQATARWPFCLLAVAPIAFLRLLRRRQPTQPMVVNQSPSIRVHPLQGQVIQSSDGVSYQVGAQLGAGGNGEVVEVTVVGQSPWPFPLAAKVFFPAGDQSAYGKRCEREVRICSILRHEGLVPVVSSGVLRLGEVGERPFMVMERVQGRTVHDLLQAEPTLAWPRATRLLQDILRSLAAAHGQGIVHRDLKPANVMLQSGDRVRVLDFGLALGDTDTTLTSPDCPMGTPLYMAPEQFDDSHSATAAVDVYAAGAMAYRMISGHLPWTQTTVWGLLLEKTSNPVPALCDVCADVPAELSDMVARMMAPNAESRYSDAATALRHLERLQGAWLAP
jgi:serine/threonine-protein kinase